MLTAFGYVQADAQATRIEAPQPHPTEHDLLVKIEAIAVNPVDTKVKSAIDGTLDTPKIIGWDACGTVIDVGDDSDIFKVGDRVYYAGDITRDGCYVSHQLVDARIVAHAPKSLSAIEAAALPLTSITAWEALFSRMRIHTNLDRGKTILIIGGAGGVGSMAIQLAKQEAGLTVIATASRQESQEWCYSLGADHVIGHDQLQNSFDSMDLPQPDYILCLADTDHYFDELAELVAPQGLICFVVTSQKNHNIDKLKTKSAGIVWEFMFTRPMFATKDMAAQHRLLMHISELIDHGKIKTTLTQNLGAMSEESLALAHQQLLSGHSIGKIGLTAIEI